jgi:hypothetical protein
MVVTLSTMIRRTADNPLLSAGPTRPGTARTQRLERIQDRSYGVISIQLLIISGVAISSKSG